MSTRVVLTGVTGNAGSALLTEALASADISHVTVLSRRPPLAPNDSHPKLTTIILPSEKYPKGFEGDSLDPGLMAELKASGVTSCIWALGISQTKVSNEDYIKITHDYTLTAARAFASISSPSQTSFRFIFMSGEGADQTEQSRYLFGRIKGRTEKALAAMETETFKTISVRPGGIVPTESHRKTQGWVEGTILPAVCSVLKYVAPNMMISATDLGKACLNLARDPSTAPDSKVWGRRTKEGWVDNAVLRELAKS